MTSKIPNLDEVKLSNIVGSRVLEATLRYDIVITSKRNNKVDSFIVMVNGDGSEGKRFNTDNLVTADGRAVASKLILAYFGVAVPSEDDMQNIMKLLELMTTM